MESCGLYIGGRWLSSGSGHVLESRSPTDEDLDVAVDAARKALSSWKGLSAPRGGEMLLGTAAIVRQRKKGAFGHHQPGDGQAPGGGTRGEAHCAPGGACILQEAGILPWVPKFGVVKQSGSGTREAGTTAIEEFTELKTVSPGYSVRLQKAQVRE